MTSIAFWLGEGFSQKDVRQPPFIYMSLQKHQLLFVEFHFYRSKHKQIKRQLFGFLFQKHVCLWSEWFRFNFVQKKETSTLKMVTEFNELSLICRLKWWYRRCVQLNSNRVPAVKRPNQMLRRLDIWHVLISISEMLYFYHFRTNL